VFKGTLTNKEQSPGLVGRGFVSALPHAPLESLKRQIDVIAAILVIHYGSPQSRLGRLQL